MNKISGLMRSTRAATAVEYGLILALIFIALIAAVGDVATQASAMWSDISSTSEQAMDGQ